MSADTTAVFSRDVFRGRTKWLAVRAPECVVEDEERQPLCHCRALDTTCRRPLVVTDGAEGSRELLRILRPEENFRVQSLHEGIPATDNVYFVTDLTSNCEVGIIQKPWLKGVWRDVWIVRQPDWTEICHVEQSSLVRAWTRTFFTALPGRYTVLEQGRPIGTIRSSWYLARLKAVVDLREDPEGRFERRLALALLVLLLTR